MVMIHAKWLAAFASCTAAQRRSTLARLVLLLPLSMCTNLISADTLNLVINPYPPFTYEQEGQATGVSTEIVLAVFARMGQPVAIKIFPLARSLSMVSSGAADGIFNIQKTPDREAFANFSQLPVIKDSISLFVRQDSNIDFSGDLRAISRYPLCVIIGAKQVDELDQAIQQGVLTKVIKVSEFEQCVKMLLADRVDIIAGPRHAIIYAQNKTDEKLQLKELIPPINDGASAYLAFTRARDLDGIKDDFDATLKAIIEDGTYAAILQRHGMAPPTQNAVSRE